MDVRDAQAMQREFDKLFWARDESLDVKLRHILLHLNKLMGKFGEYCERREHGIEVSTDRLKREVVPDLFVYALQIANELGVDLETVYKERLENNKEVVQTYTT